MVLFNIIYILVALYISFNRPTLFFCAYILFYTQYLGFIPNNIILSGVDYGTFFFNIIIILPLIIKGKIQKTFDHASKYAILFVTLFILYGVLKPYLDGTQSILMGVKASKSFLTYTILIYLMLYRKHINFNIVFYFIRLIAFYFSLLYFINTIGIRIIPPCYVKYDYLQCQYDSFIAFAIIILYYQHLSGTFVRFFALKITILMIGLLLGGYFSLFATSLFILLVFHIRKYCINLIDYFITIVFIGLLFITFLQVVISTDWFHQIEIKQTNALLTREKYNEFRWAIIHKNLWFGFGLRLPDAALFQSIWFSYGVVSNLIGLHVIRTAKTPFIESHSSKAVYATSIGLSIVAILIPFTFIGKYIGLVPIPLKYFSIILLVPVLYCFLATIVKRQYIKKYKEWL